jgi:pyridoxal phosphate enzyme (YggS family)
MNRRDELESNLQDVKAAIAQHCQELGRELPTLIVVTKTKPTSDMELLGELGVTDVGENRDQEAKVKHDECSAKFIWHAIGQLQTNKAKSVAAWADVVHSVDRSDLVTALDKATSQRDLPLKCLIQVNLDPDTPEHRGGCLPSDVLALAAQINACPGLQLQGVMGVAPLEQDPNPAFELLQRVAKTMQIDFPDATWISAGMSEDYPNALKYGATHLRIGSTILGSRTVVG